MAIRYAIKDGNWSDPDTWDGGLGLPTAADDVYSNTFTVTVDVSPTVLSIRNGSTTGVASGGFFTLSNGVTLTATASIGAISAVWGNGVITFSLPSPNIATFVGNIRPETGAGASNESSGTLNIIGNITGSPSLSNNNHGTVNLGAGIINVTGNVTGGGSNTTTSYGILNSGSGTVNITGDVLGGTVNGLNHGVFNGSSGSVTVIGSITGGTASGCAAIVNGSIGTITVTGSATAGTNSNALQNNFSGTANHNGTVTASITAPAIGPGSVSQLTFLTGPFIGHPNGTQANTAAAWRWNLANPATYIEVYSSDLLDTTPRTLYTADFVGGNPDASDVRLGTTFGPVAELTGTMAVPDPVTVSKNTPVDDTVGTAAISAEELWSYPLTSMSVPGSIGARLRHVLTEQVLGQYLAAFGAYEPGEEPPAPPTP